MLPEEVTKFIGIRGEATVLEVERGAIQRYTDAVGDQNRLFWDDEYARNSKHGSIIAPPGYFGCPTKWRRGGGFSSTTTGAPRVDLSKGGFSRGVLDGGMEFEFLLPIRPGDTLVSSSVIKDIYEREGRTGKMAFVITETTYTNQNGDVVAKTRGTMIHQG